MILVTGMHRSGTSLLAMTLARLGLDFGPDAAFYQADQWNAKGYFERRDVIDLDSRMISGLDRTGSAAARVLGQLRYVAQPDVHRVAARGPRFTEAMRTIERDTGGGAIKDPRLCLTWSAWAEAVPVDAVVVAIRHPFDVADSLRRRQSIPMRVGFRFWRYHIDALRRVTPSRLVVVDTEALAASPREELAGLVASLGLDVTADEAVARFGDVHSAELTTVQAARPPLDRRTEELWAWLHDQRRNPDDPRAAG